jgi:hypothetical protein
MVTLGADFLQLQARANDVKAYRSNTAISWGST